MPKIKNWSKEPWRPEPGFQTLFHQRSGNEFNGLGEDEQRRPGQIFWHRKSQKGPFGDLQDAVVARHNSVPVLLEEYVDPDRGPKSSPVAETRVELSPEEASEAVSRFALVHEADQIRFTVFNPEWAYEGHEDNLPYLAIIVVAMDHDRSEVLPSTEDDSDWVHEVAVQYNRGARAAAHTAAFIGSMGYRARPHAGPWIGSLNLLPAAIAAGVGGLGKHGSLINRELGSSFRLAAVETDLPLASDQPDRFGADEFCERCQVCSNACPPQAIFRQKQTVRGESKWYVDFDRCIGYFNETFGCAICIAVCPWSTPGRAPKLAEKWTKRMKMT
jgi:Pyruvate/2-oxoacid:ferredoxin oxidoreductase delta subunit